VWKVFRRFLKILRVGSASPHPGRMDGTSRPRSLGPSQRPEPGSAAGPSDAPGAFGQPFTAVVSRAYAASSRLRLVSTGSSACESMYPRAWAQRSTSRMFSRRALSSSPYHALEKERTDTSSDARIRSILRVLPVSLHEVPCRV
jgi:hypothetical protein